VRKEGGENKSRKKMTLRKYRAMLTAGKLNEKTSKSQEGESRIL
jgi:hypothetical protein